MLIRLTRRYNGVMVESVVFHQRQHRGTAGPTTSPQSRRQKDTTWIQYDRAIFSRVYDEYALNEYLSAREFGGGALSSSQQRAAILERCCILSRKGMWNLAAADLKTFAGLIRESHTPDLAPSERTTLRRFFGPYSYAEHTLADAGIFFGCLRNSFSPRLRLQFAIQLLSPWLIELINFLRTMQFRCFLGRTRKCLLLCVKMLKSPRIAQTSVGPVSRSEF